MLDVKNESRVLVLYTGGTIGMVRNAEGNGKGRCYIAIFHYFLLVKNLYLILFSDLGALAPAPNAMEAKIRF